MKKCILFLLSLTLLTLTDRLAAQGTTFTYQGQLNSSGSPANGNYDFTFALFNNSGTNSGQLGGTITQMNIGVTNGLFLAALDFPDVFAGEAIWLAIDVRTNGGSSFTALNPLQEIASAPYAITASNVTGTVPTTQLSGTLLPAQLPSSVLTNNDTNVSLVNLKLTGNLTLPSAATIESGNGSLLLSAGSDNFYAGPGAGTVTNSGSANTGIGHGHWL
jgi:hypothetical protein